MKRTFNVWRPHPYLTTYQMIRLMRMALNDGRAVPSEWERTMKLGGRQYQQVMNNFKIRGLVTGDPESGFTITKAGLEAIGADHSLNLKEMIQNSERVL